MKKIQYNIISQVIKWGQIRYLSERGFGGIKGFTGFFSPYYVYFKDTLLRFPSTSQSI
jgi:hypothetical protein